MKRPMLWELTKYVLVGLLGAVVDFGLFFLLTRVGHLGAVPANLISVFVAILHNFVWHKFFTFRVHSRKKIRAEFSRFFVVSAIAYVVQEIGLPLGLLLPGEELFGHYEDLMVKVVIIAIVGFLGYFANRAWTFAHRHETTDLPSTAHTG